MVAKNDITGDQIRTRVSTDKYRNGWDLIFKRSPIENNSTKKDDVKDEHEQKPCVVD
jgi:hypothetical protein